MTVIYTFTNIINRTTYYSILCHLALLPIPTFRLFFFSIEIQILMSPFVIQYNVIMVKHSIVLYTPHWIGSKILLLVYYTITNILTHTLITYSPTSRQHRKVSNLKFDKHMLHALNRLARVGPRHSLWYGWIGRYVGEQWFRASHRYLHWQFLHPAHCWVNSGHLVSACSGMYTSVDLRKM